MNTEQIIGQIYAFAFSFTPKGWLPCDGRLLSISQNSALYSLLGTTYGGDGRVNFGIPDLRGRTLIGQGQSSGGGDTHPMGEKGGSEEVVLSPNQMPQHSHSAILKASEEPGDTNFPEGKVLAASAGDIYTAGTPEMTMGSGSIVVGSAGQNMPHPNMQPYLTINYCIAVQGIYPSQS